MYRIIITAGGSKEAIDNVRAITNAATGTLGSKIADEFLNSYSEDIEELIYIYGVGSKLPVHEAKVRRVPVESAVDLLDTIQRELKLSKTDIVIHSMAVSDYKVDRVLEKQGDAYKEIDNSTKISSDIEELAVILKKNPKVIKSIKECAPRTVLVGFKLLSNVSEKELLSVAKRLMDKNNCDFVLANDLKDIKDGKHKGYLISKTGRKETFFDKNEIAKGIVKNCIDELGSRK